MRAAPPANASAPARATVVFVQAFAEEMNKSRRMVALQSRALAQDSAHHLLLWQPMLAGKTLVQQFLRLKAAAGLVDGTEAKSAMATLRAALAAGQSVEVAGYPLPAALMNAIEAATLTRPGAASQVHWLEGSPRTDAGLSPAAAKPVEAWRGDGLDVRAQVVTGPAFWQATEIEVAPALLPATLTSMGLAAGVPA